MLTYAITQINRIVECPRCCTILDGIEIDLDDDIHVTVGQVVVGWCCCDECGLDICDDYVIRRRDLH